MFIKFNIESIMIDLNQILQIKPSEFAISFSVESYDEINECVNVYAFPSPTKSSEKIGSVVDNCFRPKPLWAYLCSVRIKPETHTHAFSTNFLLIFMTYVHMTWQHHHMDPYLKPYILRLFFDCSETENGCHVDSSSVGPIEWLLRSEQSYYQISEKKTAENCRNRYVAEKRITSKL